MLPGQAVSKIVNSGLEMLTITESIQATDAVKAAANIRQLSIAPLIADAMNRIHTEKSVSSLFD